MWFGRSVSGHEPEPVSERPASSAATQKTHCVTVHTVSAQKDRSLAQTYTAPKKEFTGTEETYSRNMISRKNVTI